METLQQRPNDPPTLFWEFILQCYREDRRNRFLDTYGLPKLNQDVINSLNKSITSNETDRVIKSLLAKQEHRTWCILWLTFTRSIKALIHIQVFHTTERRECSRPLISGYCVIFWYPDIKTSWGQQKGDVIDEHRGKNHQKNTCKLNLQLI